MSESNIGHGKFLNQDFYWTKFSKKVCVEKNIDYVKPISMAIADARENNNIIVRRGYLSKSGREYNQYGTLTYDLLDAVWKNNNGMYEILTDYRKLYFDIEYPTDGDQEAQSKTNHLIVECIKDILNDLDIPYNENDFAISHCDKGKFSNGLFEGVNKFSSHIVCNNDFAFHSVQDIKIFKDYLGVLLLTEKYQDLWFETHCAIDTQVYGNNQCFKLPYQTKAKKKKEAQEPLGDCELHQFLVSYNSHSLKKINVDKIKTENTTTLQKIKVKHNLKHIPQKYQSTLLTYAQNLEKAGETKYKKTTPVEELNVETLLSNIYNGEEIHYQIYMAVGTAVKRCCNDKTYAFQLWDNWTKQDTKGYNAIFNKEQFEAYSEASCGYTTLLNLASMCNPNIATFNSNPINYILNDNLHLQTATLNQVNQRYIQIDKQTICENDFVFIRSPMGTGKSYMLHKMLEYEQGGRRMFKTAIYLSSRQAFACAMGSDFEEDGFVNYMDYENFTGNNKRVIVSLESIHRVNHNECDLLIIDESESIFNIFSSETLLKNELETNLVKLKNLILNSKKVLVMDAFLSNRSFKAVMDICDLNPNNTYYLKNDFKYEERKAMDFDKPTMIMKIIENLKHNKRVVVCSGSKKYGEEIVKNVKEHFPEWKDNEEILFYNAHNQLPNKTNVNEEWSSCCLLIYSPTITCGISYTNTDEPFDNLFIYCVNKGSSHFRDTIQAHKRVRNFTDNTIGICVNDNYTGFSIEQYPINYNVIKEYLRDYRFQLFKKEDYETITLEDNDNLKEWVFDIHCFNIMEKNIHSLYLRKVVDKYFEMENIKWVDTIDPETFEIEEMEKDDWKSADIELIDKATCEEYTREFEMKIYDEDSTRKYKEVKKFNFHAKFHNEKMDMFDEVFDEWFMEDRRKYINNISAFKRALKDKIQEYINKKNPTKYVEYFKQNLLAFQHCVFMLDKLNLLTENKTDLNFKNEFSTLEFQPLIDTYKNMKSLSINQLFHDEYYDMKTKDRKEKTITTRSIHTILNKILKEYFNYEIESCGKKQKTIDGKRKKITMYKIVPNQEKDENSKLPPIKHNLFEFIKLDQFVNIGMEDMFEEDMIE